MSELSFTIHWLSVIAGAVAMLAIEVLAILIVSIVGAVRQKNNRTSATYGKGLTEQQAIAMFEGLEGLVKKDEPDF